LSFDISCYPFKLIDVNYPEVIMAAVSKSTFSSYSTLNNTTARLSVLEQQAADLEQRVIATNMVKEQIIGLKIAIAFAKLRVVNTYLSENKEALDFTGFPETLDHELRNAQGRLLEDYKATVTTQRFVLQKGVKSSLAGNKIGDLFATEASRVGQEMAKVQQGWTLTFLNDLEEEKKKLKAELESLQAAHTHIDQQQRILSQRSHDIQYSSEVLTLKQQQIELRSSQIRTIHDAAAAGDLSFLRLSVRQKTMANDVFWSQLDDDGQGVAHLAAENGQIEALRYILASGANPTQLDKSGYTPLHRAAKAGKVDAVKALLDMHIISPRIEGSFKKTPLHLAARYKQAEVIEILLAQGANINSQTDKFVTPLHEAVTVGDANSARALLKDRGLNVNLVDKHGHSPLYYAIALGFVDIAGMIVGHRSWELPKDKADSNHLDQLQKIVPPKNGPEIAKLLNNLPRKV